MLNKKKTNEKKDSRNKKVPFKKLTPTLISFLVVSIFLSIFSFKSPKDKELILKEPTKVTNTQDFEALVKEGAIKSVYLNDETPVLLFTVKDGVKVKSVDYETKNTSDIDKLITQSEKYLESNSNKKDYILTYRTFNPNTESFRELLSVNNVQIFKLPVKSDSAVKEIIKTLLPMCIYFALFKFLFFPSGKEKQLKDSDIPDVKFKDVAGNKEAKEELMFLVDFFKNPEEFKKMGATVPKGILLNGSPGNGKTLLAKAIAGEAGVPFFDRSGTDFIDKFVGVGPQKIRELFKIARAKRPCIIFIDEIDSIGAIRGGANHREYDNTLNQLLVELDGFKSSENIIVIAATNRIDALDPALIRPGRFDRHININPPDKNDREELLNLFIKDKPMSPDIDIKSLAGLLYGFSGAKIKSLINDAALTAARKKHDMILQEDIDEAFTKSVFGSNPKKRAEDNSKNINVLAYHEAGHALVTKLWTDNVINKVTIIGTTGNTGGFTSSTPSEEMLPSRKDLYDRIRVLYGGRIAEYLYFNKNYDKVTTGASNDLKEVGLVLDAIIKELGMNESILFKLSDTEMNKDEILNYKRELAAKLYDETLESLEANKEALDLIVESLIEKESLTGAEVDEILNKSWISITKAMEEYSVPLIESKFISLSK